MQNKKIIPQDLKTLLQKIRESGYRVIAPGKLDGPVLFGEISSYEEYDESCLKPKRSIKEFFFPRHENICKYRLKESGGAEIDEIRNYAEKTLVFGCRPCDAASLSIMDKVFEWDYKDNFYLERRKNTTVISFACERADDFCMCTTLGYSPLSEEGSDILLIKDKNGSFYAKIITSKGEEIVNKASELFSAASQNVPESFKGPSVKTDKTVVKPWLDSAFDDSLWDEIGMRCLGCGTCTYVCPTCHCFDIVDEGGLKRGSRVKNWDSCQFGLFTMHASGHNPRPTQDRRFRQRIMHKFKIYVDKFNIISCVGCGRCSKSCPVDINIGSVLNMIEKRSAAAGKKE
ncbi:MAG: 4Fe-4S dicluster domain-containing protein [bacterium]